MIQMKCKTWLDTKGLQKAVRESLDDPLKECAIMVTREAKRGMKSGGKAGGRKARRKKKADWDAYRSRWKGGTRKQYNNFIKGYAKWEEAQQPSSTASDPGEPPNVQSGQLRSSIRYEKKDWDAYLVGPTRLAHYGRVHEFGAVIRVTDKMRGFLAVQKGWHLKRSTTQIRIPPRPFMRPALFRSIAKFPDKFRGLRITYSDREVNLRQP